MTRATYVADIPYPERHKYLTLYESGVTQGNIAKRFAVTLKIVKAVLKWAKENRAATEAQTPLSIDNPPFDSDQVAG